MSDSSSSHCPQCGAETPNATDGLCPRCLMAQIIQPTQDGGENVAAIPPLTPAELAPHFPQFEIIECLGRGGMGVVYKARQKSLNRFVALKLLAPERADDPQFAARFEKEAQALAALNHPHIVGVYDFGQAGGFYYLLMEFVDGVNLRQLLQAKRLTPKEALSIVPPVCDALQCAHDHGIVHRDIKPENLLIDKTGVVKIADFGIAKIVAREASRGSDDEPREDSRTTALGTPDYAAPEQQNGNADHRVDIYSLGVVLYEMLTGERPKDKIEAPSKRVQVDIRIDEIVLRALEKEPERRYQTAVELKTMVQAMDGPPPPLEENVAGTVTRNPPLLIMRGGRRRLCWPGVLLLCGTIGLVVLGGNLAVALGIWLFTGQPWPMFDPHELPWMLALMAVCFVMRLAGLKLAANVTAAEFRTQVEAAVHDMPHRVIANPWPRRIFILLAVLLLGPVLAFIGILIPSYQRVGIAAEQARAANLAKHLAIFAEALQNMDEAGMRKQVEIGERNLEHATRTYGENHPKTHEAREELKVIQEEVQRRSQAKPADPNAADLSPGTMPEEWIVEGRVMDDANKPVPDADIHVSAGMGSLHVTSEGKTGADGRYRVTFGPGFSMAKKDRAGSLQAALVHVGKDGYTEKNLCEAGNLQMAWELTKQQLAGGWQPGPTRTFLPGKPLAVDFVLVPAAQIQGTLIDKGGKPVANREIVITGDRIGPGGSIYGATRTDSQGRFTFKDVSTQHAWSFSIDDRSGHPNRTPPDRFRDARVHEVTFIADGDTLKIENASPKGSARTDDASPITSSIGSNDNSPDAIAKAQQLGVAAAAKDIQALNFRILAYGVLMDPAPRVDEETGYRIQSVAGSILSSAFQAECDAYNFAMRDHFQKHVRWKLPVAKNVATQTGSYELPQDLKLVITEAKRGKADEGPIIDAQLVWGPSYTSKPGQSHEFRLSEGHSWAVAWSADGMILWVTCSTKLGSGKDERIARYLRILTVEGLGEVDEELTDFDKVNSNTRNRLPKAMQAMFPPTPGTATTTIQGTMNDDDLKKLSWHEFDQTPGKYWRELADVRRYREAAALIERCLSLKPELDPINAADLHFHAAQCWALAGEKEHALSQLNLARHPSGTTIGLRWNDYVNGTEAFLKGDKRELLNAHESLAEGDPVNQPNLCVLDRLIANFGKSYAEAYETDGQDDKKLSADCFNRAWELLEKKNRSTEDDERMISLAHASLAHWRMREDCTDRNLSIGYWQISRVYAVLGQGNNAERYGGLCLRVSGKEPPFYLGYAHEALARAALLNERRELFDKHLTEAKALAAKVTDADEKKMLEDDLATLLWP
ncbi:protein kinase [Prosthecobacter sp.]|uniref:serine/threonine-protein kinase n=1 Tax=Prosthecobacter sp. TaxID=1965333 RepID=UPI002AB9810C|nr:protein kinase [Prosthecobacter sp.]MDZ4405188.1 protein kinase [Prosthecobacter sp.]